MRRFTRQTSIQSRQSPLVEVLPGPNDIFDAFKFLHDNARSDTFRHRQTRLEAELNKRAYTPQQYIDQLELNNTGIPLYDEGQSEKNGHLHRFQRDMELLASVVPDFWSHSAWRLSLGNKSLVSMTEPAFLIRSSLAVAELIDDADCSWALSIALYNAKATVYSTFIAMNDKASQQGPPNWRQMQAAVPWRLPHRSDSLDIISARSLHQMLHTPWRRGKERDEWCLTLSECFRCLKPGGCLEFVLFDSELVNAGPITRAIGREFSLVLKTRGYEPFPGNSIVPRLRLSGFSEIRATRMLLPVGDHRLPWVDAENQRSRPSNTVQQQGPEDAKILLGSTADVQAITGLAATRFWDRWRLKLCAETGDDKVDCLKRSCDAANESARLRSAHACRVGWARKPWSSSGRDCSDPLAQVTARSAV